MKQAQRGFTLLEIMVVVVILGILSAMVVPQIMGNVDKANRNRAKSDLSAISGALDMYRLDNHFYPSTEQGIEALVSRPSGAPEPKNYRAEGYLPKMPTDPWGNPYQYLYPGEHGAYDLWSLGADGVEGGEGEGADLGNWMD